ncbi:HNH endonuclease [Aquihabitans sp. G128]|uniref:HNH endonuclease signature motif containing protein n=1 Tax=Aquihabitans sp. G128 TaxID=2849779 RepID=UPI001C221BB0|nr:HNH endonuclease signature motif containing protein [Aquihabitans sp. G128]QXC61351.1 HNH endonuclease [Aquihabitans sp. G128]
MLHVRGDGCTMDDGSPVSDSVAAQIAPDAFLRALIHDAAGNPVDASPRRRVPTDRQKRVVKERDRHCVDCGSTALLEYDHVPPYELSGQTVTSELQLRCAPCHRRRHRSDAA